MLEPPCSPTASVVALLVVALLWVCPVSPQRLQLAGQYFSIDILSSFPLMQCPTDAALAQSHGRPQVQRLSDGAKRRFPSVSLQPTQMPFEHLDLLDSFFAHSLSSLHVTQMPFGHLDWLASAQVPQLRGQNLFIVFLASVPFTQ
eukprot:GEMP01038496.1.p2 GENE.GEMP01038496.1~~GEMP01038496.1.p2  ORF type:complete len:145 (-),score=13.31 GEMP01038496.1:296-730(-)